MNEVKRCTCPISAWIGSEPNDSTCELSEEEHHRIEATRAEAERPKVELPPYDERCKEEIGVASRKEMGAIYTIFYYKAELDSRERQLLDALTEIAELKARLQK